MLQRGHGRRSVKQADAHLDAAAPVDLAAVPEPYDARGEADLDETERTDLATCERAIAGLQHAFATAGKALAAINRARLYRETHPTFEAYVEDRWEMQRAHAYRLMEAWPVAAALSPNGRQTLNERQSRELVKVAKAHGVEAAVELYRGVAALGDRVTAARLERARRALPSRLATPGQARDVVRVAAAEGRLKPPAPRTEQPPAQDDEDDVHDAELVGEGSRAVAILAMVADRQRRLYDELGGGVVADALTADPGRAENLLREIGQYANRTAYRARQTKPGAEAPSQGTDVGAAP
ncbi:MAG: hypothetical protein HOY76_08395 [Streptomyces sp.]|nr:hypothetical protein [Streptomyces sp.]